MTEYRCGVALFSPIRRRMLIIAKNVALFISLFLVGQAFGFHHHHPMVARNSHHHCHHLPHQRMINFPTTTTTLLSMALGDFTVELSKPLGMILQERDESDGGVQVKELVQGGAAATKTKIVPGDVLLRINDVDVSNFDFDSVMDLLMSIDDNGNESSSSSSLLRLTLGDGLGQMNMPKNVVKLLQTKEDAFFIDAVVRQAVREIRSNNTNILGDLLNVEVIIGAGVQQEQEDGNIQQQGKVRFFAIFSTDGVTSYSCNVSATGIRCPTTKKNNEDDEESIQIISLSAAKDEGLGQTYDFI